MTAFISKILAIFMTLVSIILPAKPNNVKLTVSDTTTASTSISYTCVNNTGRSIGRPDIVCLEKNIDGQWQESEISFGRTEEYFNVAPGSSCKDSIFFGISASEDQHLESGEYRLTISYKIYGLSQQHEGQTSTVFTVTEA